MRNDLSRNVRRVASVLLGLLVVLFIYVSYLQVVESSFLAGHALNRRSVEIARRVERGQIIDRKGERLAVSEKNGDGVYQRQYIYGPILAPVIGYDSAKYGKAGLESTYNGYLSGLTNPVRQLGPIAKLWQTTAGNNLVLTIDAELQKVAYRALGNRRGAVVAIAPKTGEILAMVSKPSFDPSLIDADWETLSKDADSPLLNRAVQGLYPPGSTVKVIVAETALAEKIARTGNTFNCNGSLQIGPDYVLHEAGFKAHGKVDLTEALAVSCNVTFGQLALDLGRSKLAKAYERYGFDKAGNSELQEADSRMPEFSRLSDGDLAQAGIGQGSMLVTPLRMALVAAAFANNGVVMRPYLVESVTAPDGSVLKQAKPQEWLKPTTPQLAQTVKQMMVAVVTDGTGAAARISGIHVAGKTGSAENPHGAAHAWFIGFAPAANPEIAVAVIVENAGSGGGVAAPIARQVIAAALR